MSIESAIPNQVVPSGLSFWMASVVRECDLVRQDFAPKPVHNLRVALRRCRSIADGFMNLDPHPAWEQMKKEGAKLFRRLGNLRDIQVTLAWIQQLAPAPDDTANALNCYLVEQEARMKQSVRLALQNFSYKKWSSWGKQLAKRAQRVPVESLVFQHLALERWNEARALHHQALRNRSQASYHRLRIGLKKFRYTVENFLPYRHEQWGRDLKEIQDALGEMHDLFVLWRTAVKIRAFSYEESRLKWRQQIAEKSQQRLDRYRQKMVGMNSLWLVWRACLPDPDHIMTVAMARLETWASFCDPDFSHSKHVTHLALQLYDGLNSSGLIQMPHMPDARYILHAAALTHDTGRAKIDNKHHKASYKMIRRLDPPLGWSAERLQQVALVARYHRGTIPHSKQKRFNRISQDQRDALVLLAAILRLANAFDLFHKRRIHRLEVQWIGDSLAIAAEGYSEDDPLAEKLAGARYSLETCLRLPILIHAAGN